MIDKLYGTGMFVVYIILTGGWIYNIVWILDNWHSLSTLSKIIDVFSIFAPPLGIFFGLLHAVSSLF